MRNRLIAQDDCLVSDCMNKAKARIQFLPIFVANSSANGIDDFGQIDCPVLAFEYACNFDNEREAMGVMLVPEVLVKFFHRPHNQRANCHLL